MRLSCASVDGFVVSCPLCTDCRGEHPHLLREDGLGATKNSLSVDEQTASSLSSIKGEVV